MALTTSEMVTLAVAMTGFLFVVLGFPLYRGRVAPNIVYGCRTRRTLSDPKIWYPVNRRGGRNFMIAGVLVAGIAKAMYFFPPAISENLYAGVLVALVLGAVIVVMIDIHRFERSLP